jgi:hypothetical protein
VGDRLMRAKPVYEYMDGFLEDISGCRRFDHLPREPGPMVLKSLGGGREVPDFLCIGRSRTR